jgi:hypothetical protein
MRFLAVVLVSAAVLAAQAPAALSATLTVRPAEDVGLPFWCEWGYDWEERCYTDDGPRLPVGGVDDKVWRAALRFSLAGLPPGATITSARLRAYHDQVCVAPRLRSVSCAGRTYTVDAHGIVSTDWYDEREPEFDETVLASTTLWGGPPPQWVSWDVTALARAWQSGAVPNAGILLKLAEEEEGYDVSGPYLPSSSYATWSLRPALVVGYATTAG